MGIRWSFVLLAYFSLFFMGLIDNIRGPIYPYILEELSLDSFSGSFFFALASFFSFVSTLTADYWLPLTGPSRSMKIGWTLVSLSCLALGLSSYMQSDLVLFIASSFLGLGIGTIGMSMNILISLGSTTQTRRRLFGGLHACYGIASLGAPLVFELFQNLQFNWGEIIALVSLLSLPLFLSFKKVQIKPEKSKELKKSLLASPLLSLMIGTYVASEIVVSSRLVLYLKEIQNFSSSDSSLYLSLFFFFLMLGRIAIAATNLKIDSVFLMKLSLLMTSLFVFMGLTISPLMICLSGLSMSIFFPCAMDMINHFYPKSFEKMTASALSGLGFIVTCMHLLFGAVAKALGLSLAMGTSIIFSLTSFLCLYVIVKRHHSPH